jgi:uncharacterized protein (DUF3820 family)
MSTAVARVRETPNLTLHESAPLPDVFRLAELLVPTGMLPDTIKTAGQCVAIILAGRELAMPPMRALRSLVLVKGKVVESADSQLSRFKTDGGRAQFKALDETRAVLWLRHPNGDEHTETFTMQDAERAGLTKPDRNGGPSMFVKYPKPMLRSRVITAGLKSIGWEGGVGAYDPDEAQAFAPARGDDVARHAPQGPIASATMSLDDAKAFVMPMGKFDGSMLEDIPTPVLRAALIWTADHDAHPDFQLALSTVLDAREKAAKPASEAEGVQQPGDVAVSDSPVQTTERTLATASSGAATSEDSDDRTRWSAARLQKHVLDLLTHPALSKQLVAGYKDQINAGLTKVQLIQISQILDEKILLASAVKA